MSAAELIYDSAAPARPVRSAIANLARRRSLLALLVQRDLSLRYRRSVLGIWWTLLNPALQIALLWIVFSNLFRFQTTRVPYLVYLSAGIVVITFFQQTVQQVGSSLTASSGLLSKVDIPAELFAVAAGLATATNFVISIGVLLVLELFSGSGIPLTVLLVPLPLACLMGLATGLGLVVASLAVRFHDALDLTNVALGLLGYLTPTFYLESIVPPSFQPILHANPLLYDLRVFRAVVTDGAVPAAMDVIIMISTSLLALALGSVVFARSWRSMAVRM